MKKYDYYRPSASSLGSKRNLRKKSSAFPLFKILLLIAALALVGAAGYLAVSKGYAAFSSSKIANWRPKEVVVAGIDGQTAKELAAAANEITGGPVTSKQAAALQSKIAAAYPQFRRVTVRRGLVSGKLLVTVTRRQPVAKFELPGGETRYIDADSAVYADPNPDPLKTIPFVEMEGKVPEKLSEEFVDLVQSTLALDKELNFAFLRFNLNNNTVKMYMPDGCVIDFGTASNLKKKAARAAQIIVLARGRYKHPFTLNFAFFEEGKVFLTQTAD